MRITKLELENFKRFTKLTIDMSQLSTPPKLVLLIGANGSGKSSVFDAFDCLNYSVGDNKDYFSENNYYRKSNRGGFRMRGDFISDELVPNGYLENRNGSFTLGLFIKLPDGSLSAPDLRGLFYGRTSFRQVPKLTRFSAKNDFSVERDSDRPKAWIERDERFENDVERVAFDIQRLLFDLSKEVSNQEILAQFVQPISNALSRIFGGNSSTSIQFVSIVPPGDGKVAEILFSKGNSKVHYNFLSAGEKEVFNILLDLSVRAKFYQNSIYFIDEMDLHLEYQTQKLLLKEITENWIPDKCQLWTANHSLGSIQYANESEHAAIIDFDNLDFDLEQTIYPSPKNSTEVFEIAVSKEFLGQVFSGKRIVFAENLDAEIYNELGIKDTIFAKANNKTDVFHKSKNLDQLGLADRDYLTDEEIVLLKEKYPFLRILNYYSIENYLFHPDNLAEYYLSKNLGFDVNAYKRSLTEELNQNITRIAFGVQQARSGYPFFKENENEKQLKLFKEKGDDILDLLKSDDFETFYKVFPAKDYGKTLPERQNLNKHELGRTKWFKQQIEKVLEK